jgi:hypothetical protein
MYESDYGRISAEAGDGWVRFSAGGDAVFALSADDADRLASWLKATCDGAQDTSRTSCLTLALARSAQKLSPIGEIPGHHPSRRH